MYSKTQNCVRWNVKCMRLSEVEPVSIMMMSARLYKGCPVPQVIPVLVGRGLYCEKYAIESPNSCLWKFTTDLLFCARVTLLWLWSCLNHIVVTIQCLHWELNWPKICSLIRTSAANYPAMSLVQVNACSSNSHLLSFRSLVLQQQITPLGLWCERKSAAQTRSSLSLEA